MNKITKIKEILKEVREIGFYWRQINEIELGLEKSWMSQNTPIRNLMMIKCVKFVLD